MTGAPRSTIGTEHRVLVVDEDALFRKAMLLSFRVRGYVCNSAASSDEALSALDDFGPHIVLLEWAFRLRRACRQSGSTTKNAGLWVQPIVARFRNAFSLGRNSVTPAYDLTHLGSSTYSSERGHRGRAAPRLLRRIPPYDGSTSTRLARAIFDGWPADGP
jgi:hypothetical protein